MDMYNVQKLRLTKYVTHVTFEAVDTVGLLLARRTTMPPIEKHVAISRRFEEFIRDVPKYHKNQVTYERYLS
jgi:hypothetical protein